MLFETMIDGWPVASLFFVKFILNYIIDFKLRSSLVLKKRINHRKISSKHTKAFVEFGDVLGIPFFVL